MSELATTKRLSVWQRAIILVAVPLWAIQMILAWFIIESPGPNNDWRLFTKYDFGHYYRTSERVTSQSEYVYCVPFLEDRASSSGLRTSEVREPTNPPLLSVLLSPIAYTTPARAWAIFILLSLLVTLGSFWFCIRRWQASAPRSRQLQLLLLIALSPTVLALMIYSQVQGFILGLFLIAAALAPRWPTLSGVSLGIALALKPYGAPLLAFLLLTRRYQICAVALATATMGALLPGYVDPRLNFASFSRCGLAHVQEWGQWLGNQSFIGTLHNLVIISDGPVERHTASLISKIAAPLVWLGSGLALGAVFRRRKDFEEGFIAALALCVICAPLAWPHYYVLVWPYLIRVWRDISTGSKIILWLSFPLMPWYVAPGSSSWVSIFTHPPGATLTWVPGSIFIVQFLAILYTHTIRNGGTRPDTLAKGSTPNGNLISPPVPS